MVGVMGIIFWWWWLMNCTDTIPEVHLFHRKVLLPTRTILSSSGYWYGVTALSFLISIVSGTLHQEIVGDTLAAKYLMGGCYLRSQTSATSGITGLEVGPALISEIFFTFFVLYVAYALALHPPQLPRTGYILAPFMIGGVVALCIFSSGGLSTGYGGAGINPARCIGPATVLGGSMWTGHWVFWVGPVVSCVALALFYWTIPPDHVEMYKKRNVKLGLSRSVRRLNNYGTKLGQYGRGYFNVGSVRRGGPSKLDHVCKLEEVARGRGFGMGESELHVREVDTSHLEVALWTPDKQLEILQLIATLTMTIRQPSLC